MPEDCQKNLTGIAERAHESLDCKGLRCPMPIVRLSKILKRMTTGQTLVVEASDPAFASDVRAWVRTMGYELIECIDGPIQKAVIRKT